MSMTNNTSGAGLTTTSAAFTPEDFGNLVDMAVKAKSIAAKVATAFSTDRDRVTFPKWVADPGVGFYGELDEIQVEDGDTAEVSSPVYKTAGISRLSNELRDDSNPAVADLLGRGLSNQIARSVDAAFFANTTAKGFSGLLSIDYSVVGTSLTNLDGFVAARFAAEAAGSQLSAWIVRPAVAEALSKLKTNSTDSNESLIAFVEDGITVVGLPVLISDQVDADTIAWGIPAEHVVFVTRQGTRVERFPDVQHDGTFVRAVARHTVVFLNEPGVVRLMESPVTYTVNVGSASAGTFTLSLNGKTSATIAYNASTATVKSTIVAIDDGVSADDVTVTGSAGDYTITVPGTLTADFSGLTDGEDADISAA